MEFTFTLGDLIQTVVFFGGIIAVFVRMNTRLARIEERMSWGEGVFKAHEKRLGKHSDALDTIRIDMARATSSGRLKPHGGNNDERAAQ